MNAHSIPIGDVSLNRQLGCLEDSNGQPLHLRPKSFQVIDVLVQRRGELVTKDDLASAVWPEVAASDESLSQCISDIRRTLGKTNARLLKTIPRRGFILEEQPIAPQIAPPRHPSLVTLMITAAVALGVVFLFTINPLSRTSEAVPDSTLVSFESIDWEDRPANDHLRAELLEMLETQPADADAWARLAQTYWREVRFSEWGGGRRELTLALDAIEQSFHLGGSATTYQTLAQIRLEAPYANERSTIDALAAARSAVDEDPTQPENLRILTEALVANGHMAEAVTAIEQALATLQTPPDRFRETAGLVYLLSDQPAKAAEHFGRLYGAGTFASSRSSAGWFLAASLALAGRMDEAERALDDVRAKRPEQTTRDVAIPLSRRFGDRAELNVVIDGLKLAGMPH